MPIDVMFHEVAFGFKRSQRWRHNFLAATNLLMACFVARAAQRIFVAIPAWAEMLRPILTADANPIWLPVFSNIAVATDSNIARDTRRRFASDGAPLLGHFVTPETINTELPAKLFIQLLDARCDSRLLLLGRSGEALRSRIGRRRPDLLDRVDAPGQQTAQGLSRMLSLCDVMVQPYPDGITSRHTSAMAALAHGRPIITTSGRLTESLWRESQAVALAPVDKPEQMSDLAGSLLADGREWLRLATAGKTLYEQRFDRKHTIAALRGQPCTARTEPSRLNS
jgi:hypothetical protein